MVNPAIFRAYDIRGKYPTEINKEAAYQIGKAFVKFLNKKKLNIVIGRDNRHSSLNLKKNLIRGIIDCGFNVIDIGFSTSPMLYFAVAHFKFDAGINITASHNPKEYNGFKMVREKAIPIGGETGIKTIQKFIEIGGRTKLLKKKGKVVRKSILQRYIRFNINEIRNKKLKPLKIVVDTTNAVPGILVKEIFKFLPFKLYHLFSRLDGSFPNHDPDPHIEKNLRELKKIVKIKKANLGIAFDGDGDRVVFVDEKGKRILGDFITALLTRLILKGNPGQKILYDVRSSNIVREVVKKEGGIPIIGRIGHTFIKEKMRRENIIFQGELNGHYYFRKHYFSEAPFFAVFKIVEEIVNTGKNISTLVKPFKKYFYSGEINFRINNKERTLKVLERKFKKGKILKIDGLRIDFKDWWFIIRSSHTESALRLVVEAKTKKLMEEKKKELIALIKLK